MSDYERLAAERISAAIKLIADTACGNGGGSIEYDKAALKDFLEITHFYKRALTPRQVRLVEEISRLREYFQLKRGEQKLLQLLSELQEDLQENRVWFFNTPVRK